MNKSLALLAMALLLLGAGCSMSKPATTTPEPTPAETPSTGGDRKMAYSAYILTQIKEQTPLPFSDIQATTMTWGSASGETPVSGYEMRVGTAENIAETIVAIEDFLKDEGYAIDSYNSSDGTVVGTRGFMNENEVCRIFMQSTLETGEESIRIVCGTKQQ